MLNLLQSSPITEDNTKFRQFDDHDEESDEYDEESSSSGEEEEERKGNEQQEIPGVQFKGKLGVPNKRLRS